MAHIEAQEMINFKTRAAEDPEWVDEGVNVGHFAEGLRYKFIKIHEDPIEVSSADDWAELEVPAGEVGELIVAGEHVCREYYNFPEAFKKAKIRDVDGTIWHRTGDLARLDDKGYVWMVGRVHNVIKRGDGYCFPVRAEIIFQKLPFVKHAAYLGLPDPELGEKAVGVLVPEDAEALKDEAQVAKWRAEVKRIMDKNGVILDDLLFFDKIPMDPRHHSKVEYNVLREMLTEKGLV
jgi:acyl-CoA synthetase (AMP-forming)/AMP-acid ligase II